MDKIDKWFNNLVANRKYAISEEEVNSIWKPIKEDLNSEEQTQLLIKLVQNDSVFKWLYPISYLLPELASDSEVFASLLRIVIDKIKNDLAQGLFIRAMIKIGYDNPDLGEKLYRRLHANSSEQVVNYSGLFLGGAARKDFNKYYPVILRDIQQGNLILKLAGFRALRVVFEKPIPANLQLPKDVFQEMAKFLNEDSLELKAEIIKAYIDFDLFNPAECESKLLEIANLDEPNQRFVIVSALMFNDLSSHENEVKILKACAQDNNVGILGKLIWLLGTKGKNYLEDSLEIIKIILKKPVATQIQDMDYHIKELCKDNTTQCIATFKKYIEAEKADKLFVYRAGNLIAELEQ